MKRKKLLILATALGLMLSVNAAAETQAEEEKVLIIGQDTEPESLDTCAAVAETTYRVLEMSGEALLRYVEGEEIPGSAESYEVNENHTEYIFKLREDNCYNDGTPVTADDYVYSLLRLLNPEKAFEAVTTAFAIENAEAYYYGECDASEVGIEAVDDYTIKYTMNAPTYPQYFAQTYFMPQNEEFVEDKGETYGAEAETVLTNGPYIITDWVHDSELILEKNPNYWNADAVKLDKIVCKINAIGDTAVDMMLTGELDVANISTQNQITTLEDAGFQKMSEMAAREWLHFNHAGMTEESALFLQNVNFRKALSYAIDREALRSTAYTTGIPATRMVYPDEMGVENTYVEEYPYEGWETTTNAEKANEYLELALEELGKTREEIPAFSILCYDSNNNMTCLNAIMDMWDKTLGVKAVIDAQPIQNMFQKKENGEYDFWKGSTGDIDVDSLGEFQRYYLGSYNFEDAAYNELYETAKMAGTWEERKAAIFELEKYFDENMMDILIVWSENIYMYSDRVVDMKIGRSGFDVTFADVK